MATKIVTKNSSTASAVPTASDLVQGELAVNVADKRLFTEDNGGSIVELGTNPSTIDINAGSIDGTAIGASSASTGAFTTLTASGLDVTGTATMDGLTVDGAYTDVKFKTTQGRLDLWLTDTDTTEGQVRVRGDANNLVFITDTTERMRINSSGNVGIGTSSPTAPLHVSGSTSTVPIKIDNTGTGGDTWRIWSTNDASSDGGGKLGFYNEDTATRAMTLDSSGKVGIGTSSPVYSLDVRGEAGIELYNASGGGDVLNLRPSLGDANKYNMSISSYDHSGGGVGPADGISINAFDGVSVATGSSTARQERMRIDASGNVGIGTSSPTQKLSLYAGVGYNADSALFSDFAINDGAVNNNAVHAWRTGITGNAAGHSLTFSTLARTQSAYQERMRIDYSGNLLVGTTDSATTRVSATTGGGHVFQPNDFVVFSRQSTTASQPVVVLNDTGVDGELLQFRKDGSTVGSIGTSGGDLYIGTGDTALRFLDAGDFIYPVSTVTGTARDNAIDLGYSTGRFKDIYRSGSTYQSSDRTLKQDIRDLTDSERNVAVACKGLLKAFRFIDAVEKDGDDANIHFGVIAQELAEAFEAEGLDANDYQVYKSSTTTDENGNEQTRLSVCYENLLAFIISAI